MGRYQVWLDWIDCLWVPLSNIRRQSCYASVIVFLCGAFAMYIQGARDILHSPDLEVQ